MATVRFSTALSNQIVSAAQKKMLPAIARAKEQVINPAWGQKIYDTLFSDVKPIINQLPGYWFKKVDRIDIDHFGSLSYSYTFQIAAQPWPVGMYETDMAKRTAHFRDAITLKQHPVWDDLFAEVKAYRERIAAAETRSSEFVQMVKSVIDAHTTLAPALKMWPPLWDLIPEDVKERHRTIQQRVKGAVEVDVDLNKLTAMATAAKFGL